MHTISPLSSSSPPLPAHFTKSLSTLTYPLRPNHPSQCLLSLKQVSGSDNIEPTTGTTLWLSAQVVGLYLVDQLEPLEQCNSRNAIHTQKKKSKAKRQSPNKKTKDSLILRCNYTSPPTDTPNNNEYHPISNRPRAIDLGSGIGLTPLLLSSLGIDVLATDVSSVINTVLQENIVHNVETIKYFLGHIGGSKLPAGRIEILPLDWNTFSNTKPSSFQWPAGLQPPFDLIVTTDTIYHPELVEPLLNTIHCLSVLARTQSVKAPIVVLGIERRDSDVIDYALDIARKMRFKLERVSQEVVVRLLTEAGMIGEGNLELVVNGESKEDWEDEERQGRGEDWEGVEIWKMQLDDGDEGEVLKASPHKIICP